MSKVDAGTIATESAELSSVQVRDLSLAEGKIMTVAAGRCLAAACRSDPLYWILQIAAGVGLLYVLLSVIVLAESADEPNSAYDWIIAAFVVGIAALILLPYRMRAVVARGNIELLRAGTRYTVDANGLEIEGPGFTTRVYGSGFTMFASTVRYWPSVSRRCRFSWFPKRPLRIVQVRICARSWNVGGGLAIGPKELGSEYKLDVRLAMRMKNPPHPGQHVLKDSLEPLGLSITRGADILGVTRLTLSNLVKRQERHQPRMAICLSKAFGGRPEVWLGMQSEYDLAQAMKKAGRIKVKPVAPPASACPRHHPPQCKLGSEST